MDMLLSNGSLEQKKNNFEPYVDNGGTVAGVAGDDFAVIMADTRMSDGYSIKTRNSSKMFKFSDQIVMASSGMSADIHTLQKHLEAKCRWYQFHHGGPLTLDAFSQMLSNTLYGKRFFPYYAFNVLAGIDKDGKGCVYSYDAVGSKEKQKWYSAGSGSEYMLPLLDNQIGLKNHAILRNNLGLDDVVSILKDAFTSAGERDIHTGDTVEVYKITKEGIDFETFELKRD